VSERSQGKPPRLSSRAAVRAHVEPLKERRHRSVGSAPERRGGRRHHAACETVLPRGAKVCGGRSCRRSPEGLAVDEDPVRAHLNAGHRTTAVRLGASHGRIGQRRVGVPRRWGLLDAGRRSNVPLLLSCAWVSRRRRARRALPRSRLARHTRFDSSAACGNASGEDQRPTLHACSLDPNLSPAHSPPRLAVFGITGVAPRQRPWRSRLG
jgi:hypothetical protein